MPLIALLADDGMVGQTVRHTLHDSGIEVAEVTTPRDLLAYSGRTQPTLAVATLRLRRASLGPATRRLKYDSIVVDLDDRAAWVAGSPLALTRTEFDLLAALMSKPLHIQTRGELAQQIGLRTHSADIAPHLSRLRRKIADAGGPRIGQPVHGVGLRLTGTSRLPSTVARSLRTS